jgi:hypothetical protein
MNYVAIHFNECASALIECVVSRQNGSQGHVVQQFFEPDVMGESNVGERGGGRGGLRWE